MEQSSANIGSEHWDNINPQQPLPVPQPEKKRGKALSFFLTLSNTVLSMSFGIAVGFFVFWYAIGPKSSNGLMKNLPSSQKTQTAASQSQGSAVLAAHSPNIVINLPQIGDTISRPLHLEGSVLLLSQTLSTRLRNNKGQVVMAKDVPIKQSLPGEFTDFDVSLQFPAQPSGTTGTVEVFTKATANGRESDLIQIPVQFK